MATLSASFLGARIPFVRRQADEAGNQKLIGDAYVHKLIDGEASTIMRESPALVNRRWFTVI